jgi:hypothetical protein
MTRNDVNPNTVQRDLAKLPVALAPLIERSQFCVWRWIQKPDGSWQKPPFMATQPGPRQYERSRYMDRLRHGISGGTGRPCRRD